MRRIEQVLLGIFCVVLAGIAICALATPPWTNRVAFVAQTKLHEKFGIILHWFPDDYTGLCREWDDEGKISLEEHYRDGQRHGRSIRYERGRKISECEYRDGEPWDGVCHIRPMKAWVGEYRQGKGWNGYLPIANPATGQEWTYFVEGEVVTEADYKQRYGLPENARCIGLHAY